MKTILLKLSGPMQSYGLNSHFEHRHTQLYPSKSAIVGMIAASLGYNKETDNDKIQELNSLQFAVRTDQIGTVANDYQIARKYKNNQEPFLFESLDRNYVTNRQYLSDYIFIVAITHDDEKYLNAIEKALKKPHYQLFLGRKSYPINNDYFLGVYEGNISEALAKTEWQATVLYRNQQQKRNSVVMLEINCDEQTYSNGQQSLKKDQIISFSQKNRKFGFRYEYKYHTEAIIPKSEINMLTF